MFKYNKEYLSSLSLVEVKQICKSHNLPIVGAKSKLINSILDTYKPQVITINEYKSLFDGKKIVGVKLTDKENLIEIGRKAEKGRVKFNHYSMGVVYFSIEQD